MFAPLTLASQSPRRAALLQRLGVSFVVIPANIDESMGDGEGPLQYVQRMARQKAAAVSDGCDGVVLGADTTVIIDGDILGKPADAAEASVALARLSGRTHRVVTAVCLAAHSGIELCCVETAVEFCELSPANINAYIASGEPWDKAGGYGIQGLGGALVTRIEGSYSNVVGLPLVETRTLLEAAGISTALSMQSVA